MELNSDDLVIQRGGSEEYWLEIYRNVARADVNRTQIKNLMFVSSKLKNARIDETKKVFPRGTKTSIEPAGCEGG